MNKCESPSEDEMSNSDNEDLYYEAYYGQRRDIEYFWYVYLTLGNINVNNRIYKNKKDAITTSINILKSINNPNTKKLSNALSYVDYQLNDTIYLSENKYSVEIRRVYLYK